MVKRKKSKTDKELEALKRDAQRVARRAIKKTEQGMMSLEKKIQRYIHRHPERAAIIAAGIGAAVGSGVAAAIKKYKAKSRG